MEGKCRRCVIRATFSHQLIFFMLVVIQRERVVPFHKHERVRKCDLKYFN